MASNVGEARRSWEGCLLNLSSNCKRARRVLPALQDSRQPFPATTLPSVIPLWPCRREPKLLCHGVA